MAQYDENGNYVPGSSKVGGNTLPPGTPGASAGYDSVAEANAASGFTPGGHAFPTYTKNGIEIKPGSSIYAKTFAEQANANLKSILYQGGTNYSATPQGAISYQIIPPQDAPKDNAGMIKNLGFDSQGHVLPTLTVGGKEFKPGPDGSISQEYADVFNRNEAANKTIFEANNTLLKDGNYIPNTQLAGIKTNWKAGYDALMVGGFDELEARFIKLPDNTYYPKTDLAQLKNDNPVAYDILTENGYTAYQQRYDKAVVKLDEYKDKSGNYDIESAIYDKKVPKADITLVFGESAIQNISDKITPASDRMEAFGKQAIEAGESLRSSIKKGDVLGVLASTTILNSINDKPVDLKDYPITSSMIMKTIAKGETQIQGDITKSLAPSLAVPLTALAGLGVGVLYNYMSKPLLTTSLLAMPFQDDPRAYLKETVQGIGQGIISLPAKILANPSWEIPKTVGMVLGPVGTYKLAKWIGAVADIWNLPSTGMTFRFNTDRIDSNFKGLDELEIRQASINAINNAMKSPDAYGRGQIGNTGWFVEVKATPVNKAFGNALFRVTDFTDFGTKVHEVYRGGAEPAEFYSLRAIPRFALQNAYGQPNKLPSVVMVYTKSGQISDVPFNYNDLGELKSKGFDYLGSGEAKPGAYASIKDFKGKFELEVELPNGMKVFRVPTLRSRLLGEQSGDFVTTHGGVVIPVYRFAEAGAKVPNISLTKLAAIRVESSLFAIKKLLGDTHGFTITSVNNLQKTIEGELGSARIDTTSRLFASQVDAISTAMIMRAYNANRIPLENIYGRNIDAFDAEYLSRVNANLARAQGYTVRVDNQPRVAEVRVETTPSRSTETRATTTETRADAQPAPAARALVSAREMPTPARVTPGRQATPGRITAPRVADIKPIDAPIVKNKKKPDEVPIQVRKKLLSSSGKISWKQGFGWWVVKYPYKSRKDASFTRRRPVDAYMATGAGSAFRTLRIIGLSPGNFILNLGIVTANISGDNLSFKRSVNVKNHKKRKTTAGITNLL
jgi:hypothetical protein